MASHAGLSDTRYFHFQFETYLDRERRRKLANRNSHKKREFLPSLPLRNLKGKLTRSIDRSWRKFIFFLLSITFYIYLYKLLQYLLARFVRKKVTRMREKKEGRISSKISSNLKRRKIGNRIVENEMLAEEGICGREEKEREKDQGGGIGGGGRGSRGSFGERGRKVEERKGERIVGNGRARCSRIGAPVCAMCAESPC